MNITILNGAPPGFDAAFTTTCTNLHRVLTGHHSTSLFNLAEMHIKQCIGCWSCWWKTPGVCIHKDDLIPVMQSIVHADLLIFASPIRAGFTSSTLKTLQDRLIPLVHPYLELVQGECHHRKRYPKYPDFALLLQKEETTDQEDIMIITEIYRRLAVNFHSTLKHIWFTENIQTSSVIHELSHH